MTPAWVNLRATVSKVLGPWSSRSSTIPAHICLGSVGMEGALDAMGKGEVEEQWAREHHSIWAEDVLKEASSKAKRKRQVA